MKRMNLTDLANKIENVDKNSPPVFKKPLKDINFQKFLQILIIKDKARRVSKED